MRAQSILQQLIKFKNKAQHVACLLISFLLQLESDGHVNNLDEYPSLFAFSNTYTFWFDEFIDNYYEETHRAFIAKHYSEYGNRIRNLWENRPKRPYTQHQHYLIGKTISKETVKEHQINEIIEVTYIDITSSLLAITEENSFLNKRNIKNFPDS